MKKVRSDNTAPEVSDSSTLSPAAAESCRSFTPTRGEVVSDVDTRTDNWCRNDGIADADSQNCARFGEYRGHEVEEPDQRYFSSQI